MKKVVLAAVLLAGCADEEAPDDVVPTEADFVVTVSNTASSDALVTADGEVPVAFSPGVWVVQAADAAPVFAQGESATPGEEVLAESGQVGDLLVELAQASENRGVFGGDSESSYGDQPVMPGESVSFGFRAVEGEALSFASMFGESNDTVVTTDGAHLLFDESGQPTSGIVAVVYADAGTEVNELLGVGPNQGPRQAESTSGSPEDSTIGQFATEDPDGFAFPPVTSVIRVEIAGTVRTQE